VRVNSPPVLTPIAAQTVTDNNSLTFTVGATDVNGDTPIFHGVSLPSGATLSAQGVFNWPRATPVGNYVMTYYASDADANSAQGTVNITVATVKVNSPPILTAVAAQTVTVGNSLNFTVGATDVDGDIPILHWISLPPGATLSANGEFSWPSATPVGNYTMTYYASDAYGANSAQGTVNITVAASPPPPSTSSGGGGGGGCSIAPEGKSKGESPLGTMLALFSPGILLVVRKTMHKKRI
jgi:hypothetical protein